MSTIDIVIPCYNYARYLRRCVQSVVSQSGVNVRVLIIDDASSDETLEVGRELEASNRCVEFRRHDANKGHITTYNEGLIGWSTSEYVVLLSADDMLAPGSLGRAVRIMNADTSIGMVYGRAIHFKHENKLPRIKPRECASTQFSGSEWIEARCRAGHNVISSPEVVVRGSVQRTVGGYRHELPHAGDLEMWLRIAAVSNIAYIRNVPQAFYRVHQSSMFRTQYQSIFLDLQQRKAAFDSFFRQHPQITDASQLHNLANRALACEALWDACRAYDHDRIEEVRAHELVEFALTTYAEATSLSEHAALQRRRLLGPVVCNRTQLFAGAALIRRVRNSLLQQRWKRRGI